VICFSKSEVSLSANEAVVVAILDCDAVFAQKANSLVPPPSPVESA
jgi:hypothetical protein